MKFTRKILLIDIVLELFLANLVFYFGVYSSLYHNFYDYAFVHFKSITIINISYLMMGYFIKAYQIKRNETYQNILIKVIQQFSIFGLILFAVAGIREHRIMSNTSLFLIIFLLFFVVFILRYLCLYFIRLFRLKEYDQKTVVLIGNNDIKQSFQDIISKEKFYGLKIIGCLNSSDIKENIEFLQQKNKTQKINKVYLFLDNNQNEKYVHRINEFCENNLITIQIIPQKISFLNSDLETEYLDRFRILTYKPLPFESTFINFIKRIFDICFSLMVVIIILWWLIPLMGILIKLTSKGPVFFLQERIGVNGNPFKIIKFRTMKTDAEVQGPQLSKNKDPRITKIGMLLRKYRLDELPQFINVIKGDMSIVGPRPERQFYIDQIVKINPRYRRLHNLKPGITSLGQVYYGYAENVKEMSDRLNYDLLYLNNYNLLMDIKIIFLTIRVMVRGEGK